MAKRGGVSVSGRGTGLDGSKTWADGNAEKEVELGSGTGTTTGGSEGLQFDESKDVIWIIRCEWLVLLVFSLLTLESDNVGK